MAESLPKAHSATTAPRFTHPWRRDRAVEALALLIDPDPASSASCRHMLEDAGYRVEHVASWSDAGDVLREGVDVVVLDLAACDDDGRSAWATLMRSIPPGREPPIVLVAPPNVEPDVLAALESRAETCLVKPVRRQDLMPRVRAAARIRKERTGQMALRELRGEQARMWSVLLDFCGSTGRALDLEAVLDRIVMTAAEMTCSRRVSLMLPDESQEHLTIARAIGFDDATRAAVKLPIGTAVAGEAFVTGRQVTATGVGTRGARGRDDADYDGESFVSMPIVTTTTEFTRRSVGVLNITHRFGDRPFSEWELEFIDLLGGIAGSIIDDTLWRQARESLLRYQRDLQVARRIQQHTLPKRLPVVAGFEMDAWSEPAEETGGDSYDVIAYSRDDAGIARVSADEGERAMVMLADATGHGLGPALSVTRVQAMLRMGVRMSPDLGQILGHMNEQLCADMLRGRFVTTWLGELDATSGTITTLSAGQGPILRFDATTRQTAEIPADGPPLGVSAVLDLPAPSVTELRPGDVFAVISDGVLEATDPSGEPYGTDRAAAIIDGHRDESAAEILAALRVDLEAFVDGAPALDDRTAVIIKRATPAVRAMKLVT